MKRFNLPVTRKINNFQRNAQGGNLVCQNEANLSHREAYLPMKICKFGEASWSVFPQRLLTPKISLRPVVAEAA